MRSYRFSIVLMARWETASINEWLTYHRSIGFDHTYIYCNDDDPAELFDQVSPFLAGPAPFVTFVHYPFQGLQWDIYLHWFRNYAVQTEWAAFFDADEFLALPGLDDIREFTDRFPPDCDAIHFHWIYYGTSGFVTRPPGSVLRQYTRRTRDVSWETKTMVRAGKIRPERLRPTQLAFWHLWDASHGHELNCYSSIGEPVPTPFDRHKFAEDHADLIRWTGFVAHFALKSEADFQRRMERGLAGQFQGQHIWADSMARGEARGYIDNTNATEDLYLQGYWNRLVGTPNAASLLPRASGVNLAVGCPATQSSVSEWSRHQDPALTAAGAVSGTITGRAAFETDNEQSPWWQVDLGESRTVHEIRVFNRVDDMGVAARASRLLLLGSDDGVNWQVLHERQSDTPFGGADGHPMIWTAPEPFQIRYLRVTVADHTYLGLDQVEVYGT